MGRVVYAYPPAWVQRHVELARPDVCPECAFRHRFRWPRRIAIALLLAAAALFANV